ncbi:LysM peptidoglycan-binding domain-containing protein [Fulvivirga lutea]|uniref:LysM peptidoglycan-binding domain-containing protein n=1 Tax=Fulvivirga lutea TaxID=2810512 RepID=A0A974WG39_9BACT|nr:LysM peptidoglycan-binding domain-containing protein [Fulvivirga lutea]QSE97636.1 LysM peptidoglycan-binding domain-containing protein [Fulvivirga lutea]
MRILFLSCLLLAGYYSNAQQKRVPSRMEFAGIKLRIMDDAREEIQKDVDALTASPKYFEIKAERARTYFPIIERIFREEGLPDDFKYLCLQESALISDAVSSSNAVGYWQFKDFTAVEVGMRVDKYVDERKNIVASTRGAAKYMHNNNQFFDNWLHALQAYQMGAGGAMKVLKGQEGAKSMTIDKKTYWYVKKYLAHKIAFEGSTDQKGEIVISEYYDGAGKSLKEIANETGLDVEEVEKYNKWLSKGKIPDDKPYAVILPKAGLDTSAPVLAAEKPKKQVEQKQVEYTFDEPGEFPRIEDDIEARAGKIVEINGLPGIVAGMNDKIPELAKKADISLSKFLKYNDLGIDGKLIPGQVYYMKKKRGKAKAYYHVLQPDETLWSVSQKFGIKLKKLKVKNRIKDDTKITPGRVLWLRFIRPAKIPIEYREVEEPVKVELEQPIVIEKPKEKVVAKEIVADEVSIDSVKTSQTDTVQVELENIEVDSTAAEEETVVNLKDEEIDAKEEKSEQGFLKIHEVQLGQTYYAISKIYDVSVFEILDWNNLTISDKLSVGQKVIVYVRDEPVEKNESATPANESSDSTTKFIEHEVKEGDTLYKIARMYNVSVQDIMRWNSKEDFNIGYGEKLKIQVAETEN